jgi:hypothetical protein
MLSFITVLKNLYWRGREMIRIALMFLILLLSQVSLAADDGRNYLRIGVNPVNPKLVLPGENIFPLEDDIFMTTADRYGKRHTGWLSKEYHLVGKPENGQWRAVRIYECGNPVLSSWIILKDNRRGLYNPFTRCECDGKEWFLWSVGPGLIGYGIGAREKIPSGVGGGLIVIDLFGESDPEHRKCRIAKKGLIGIASAGIGWLIGNALYKPPSQPGTNNSSSSSSGPGPVPPNGLAVRF